MILKADTIWASRGRVIRNGAIRINSGIITQIAEFEQMERDSDKVNYLGDVILLPALINAHTHLDLSHLQGKLEQGQRFAQWLKKIARSRMLQVIEGRALHRGIHQLLGGGAGTVGDVSASGKAVGELETYGLYNSIVFLEVLGFMPEDANARANDLRTKIENLKQNEGIRLGISPHAAYSVSPELFRRCIQLAVEYDLPLAVHAAESVEEVEFLMTGGGELYEMMVQYSLIPQHWHAPGQRPIHYLDSLGILEHKPLLIHCYQVDESEADVIARYGCSVAYCPRSNAFFRRPADSLHMLIDAGVNVALGTDSLASNDSLSMLDEMRFVKQRHPDLAWETILEMATVNAAQALTMGDCGILMEGNPADITAIRPAAGRDLASRILGDDATVEFVMKGGKRLKQQKPRFALFGKK